MNTDINNKTSTEPTARRYSSVADLLKGEGASRELQESVSDLSKATQLTRQLACMRTKAGLTQAQMAERLNCTQSCISKIEAGQDDELTIRVLREYAQATDLRIGLNMGKPLTHVEAVKAHALALRERLNALAAIARTNGEMQTNIQAFFGEAFFNLLDVFESCQRQMPGAGDFEIQLEIHAEPNRRIREKSSIILA